MRFETQHDWEKVVLLLRAHPVTQIPWIMAIFLGLFVLPWLSVFISQFVSVSELVFINLFILSSLFSFALLNILLWLFNVGLVTNERIVDVDYSNLLYREVTASEINEIADATSKSGGFFESLFGYGNVYVQTAGVHQNIEFVGVPKPDEVVSIINILMRVNKEDGAT